MANLMAGQAAARTRQTGAGDISGSGLLETRPRAQRMLWERMAVNLNMMQLQQAAERHKPCCLSCFRWFND